MSQYFMHKYSFDTHRSKVKERHKHIPGSPQTRGYVHQTVAVYNIFLEWPVTIRNNYVAINPSSLHFKDSLSCYPINPLAITSRINVYPKAIGIPYP